MARCQYETAMERRSSFAAWRAAATSAVSRVGSSVRASSKAASLLPPSQELQGSSLSLPCRNVVGMLFERRLE